jgi:hypothetical protein
MHFWLLDKAFFVLRDHKYIIMIVYKSDRNESFFSFYIFYSKLCLISKVGDNLFDWLNKYGYANYLRL